MAPRPNWAKLREQLWERSEGLCEVSGLPLDPETFDAHHRMNKGMGGTTRWFRDHITNLLAVDPIVHNGSPASVHALRPWSQTRGFLLPKLSTFPPHVMPVYLHGRRWVWLTGDGGYVERPTRASRTPRLGLPEGPGSLG